MSYLSVPRLIFSGQFQADPPTANNDPEHFDTSRFRSSYNLKGPISVNGWWNPAGTGAWRLRNCSVKAVIYRDGTVCTSGQADAIVGVPVTDAGSHVPAKLADLDCEQQMVSEIWGFRVRVGGAGPGFGGSFRVAPFSDLWFRYPQGTPDTCFSAVYHSVLESLKFVPFEESRADGPTTARAASRFLAELRASGESGELPKLLSIKFTVDGYDEDPSSPTFSLGRIVGAIGLQGPREPAHFVAGRALNPPPAVRTAFLAYALLEADILTLDLGNSLATQSVGGPLIDQGDLYAALLPGPEDDPIILGPVEYRAADWYLTTGGIVSMQLSPMLVDKARQTPLGLLADTPSGRQLLLTEARDGTWVRADKFVHRLNPGDEAPVRLHARAFGAPIPNATVSLGYDPTTILMQIEKGAEPGPRYIGQPQSALSFPHRVTTDAEGIADVSLVASDPGNPRGYIDGQIYGISYALGDTPPVPGTIHNAALFINARVFTDYNVPARPTWLRDVRPIFQQYANLYPVMRPIVDLANYASVLSRIGMMRMVFGLPVEDPNYMPVTRDLSQGKRAMIRRWLERPLHMQIDSVEDLYIALQQAIELEHATIPPYLCALYSIKPGRNAEIASLLRSIVVEEMLHMALICNLFVSIGGSPKMDHAGFVPIYPGPLPAGLRGGLNVHLRRCSIMQIRDCFLQIEAPEATREPVAEAIRRDDPLDTSLFTIGWFYDEIDRALVRLSREGQITFGHPERQVSKWTSTGKLYVIRSLDDAQAAIREIKRQGEGAGPLDPGSGAPHELSHYYKFSEIVEGRRLVPTANGYAYAGERVILDEDGIWPMMDDPDIARFPENSQARLFSEQFAVAYRALLRGLHRAFNGEPDFFAQSVGLMYSLDLAARVLMQTPSGLGDGTTAGPTFQLPYPD
jgi:hypothetical protein